MALNPYASYLGDRNPVEVIAETPGKCAAALHALGAERSNLAPAPGKWSAREILCHLADCDLVFGFRLRQTLASPGSVVQPFDQDDWARKYAAYSTGVALAAFKALREWNLALIRSASPDELQTVLTHPERGTMTFQTIVETMAGHDLNHLVQLSRL
jgi:uncharacterized damage-inducible protein DinB